MRTLKQLVESSQYYPTLRSTFDALEKAMKERGGYEIDPKLHRFQIESFHY